MSSSMLSIGLESEPVVEIGEVTHLGINVRNNRCDAEAITKDMNDRKTKRKTLFNCFIQGLLNTNDSPDNGAVSL
jgi:hypothetical protein